MSESLILRPPAKINPVLEVLGKRPDGFHELALIFQTVGLYDELEIERVGSTLRMEMTGHAGSLAPDDTNLVAKAARSFLERALGREEGLRLRLRKGIPLAAGLGGGSSDAAATLLGLDRLFGTGLGVPGLSELAARLGSDVPFFLTGGTALGTGRGEIIQPLSAPPEQWLVLVKPEQGLSTPEVYRSGKAAFTDGARARVFANKSAGMDARGLAQVLYNGLEPAAVGLLPLIVTIKEALLGAGALGALVSGSGPTVFGVAKDRASALTIAGTLGGRGWDVWAVPTLAQGVDQP